MAKVPAPLFISARLMAAYRIDDVGTLHIHADHYDGESRVVYEYVVEDADGTEIESGMDLRSGSGDEIDYRAMMATLCGFLSACGESVNYPGGGDDADMFSAACAAWCGEHEEDLSMAAFDLTYDENGEEL